MTRDASNKNQRLSWPSPRRGAHGRSGRRVEFDQRRAKIVATLGPSSSTEEEIEALIVAGLDVVRLNFSHGDHDFHRTLVNRVRAVAARVGKPVAIMQDLQGPKIRTGRMENGGVLLEAGAQTVITTEDIVGTAERFTTGYKLLARDVSAGSEILLDDGNLALHVDSVDGDDVTCTVVHGGILKDRKGINLPGSKVSAPSMTEKDIRDLHFGAEVGVDAVALSFVRTAQDVRMLRRELASSKSRPFVVAKLEKPQAIDHLDGILDEADGVMVARGDLGVEIPPEQVPVVQKKIIDAAKKRGKVVIVATQMLESMIVNPRPTRAEASDVANAIFDGADCVMLSGETASGAHPVKAVEMMARIARTAENSTRARYDQTHTSLSTHHGQAVQSAVSLAGVRAADELNASAIVVFTTSGATARLVSDYRPRQPIFAFVAEASAQRRLAFAWGVESKVVDLPESVPALLREIDAHLLAAESVRAGDTVALLTKVPHAHGRRTNTLHVHVVGTAPAQG